VWPGLELETSWLRYHAKRHLLWPVRPYKPGDIEGVREPFIRFQQHQTKSVKLNALTSNWNTGQ
jgi:hypothetical protein